MTYEHKTAYFRFSGREIDSEKNVVTEAMDKASEEGWEVIQVSQSTHFFAFSVLVVFRRPRP